MLTPYSPKTGLYWPPVVGPFGPPSVAVSVWLAVLVAASTGRRRGRPPWWRPSVWLVYWLAVLAAGVRPPCWRSVRGWCPSVAVVAVFVAAGGLSAVRWSIGPPWSFRGRWRPVWALCACLSFGSVPPPLVARRRWCAVLVLACLVCAVGGRGGRVAGRPCWCRWCRCHCAVPWPVVRVAGQPCRRVACVLVSLRRPVVGRVPWSVRPCWCPPWCRSLAVSVRPCWCAGVRSVAGVRLLPCSVAVAALSGRRWCWCPSLVLAARTGRILGLADWLAVWALPVAGGGGWRCLRLRWCLPCQRTSARGWLAVGRVRCFPWWWRPLALLVVLAGVAPAAAVAARLIKGPTPAAAVAALLVVCVTCLRWRRWRRWRRWLYPCASRTTCGGRRSACRRCGILKRRNTGWR